MRPVMQFELGNQQRSQQLGSNDRLLTLTCSARLAIALMLAGSPALTTHVTIAEGMDSLG